MVLYVIRLMFEVAGDLQRDRLAHAPIRTNKS